VYSVISSALIPEPARLRAAAGQTPPAVLRRYLQLPLLPDRVTALARHLVEGQPTQYDRVMAVNRYLWSAYRFDLNIPPQRRPGDAVDYFLFEERAGYCEQFASAMVVLLRAAGIPARLVTGYTPGTLNPVTGFLEVRNSDAHAWVEVFFPGTGWVEFEPTPGFPDVATLGRSTVRRWIWQDIAGWIHPRLQALADHSPLTRELLAAGSRAVHSGVWMAIAIGSVIAAVGAWHLVGRRAFPGPARSPLGEIYAQMCALLARCGLRREAGETVREFERRVSAARDLPEVTAISAIVEQAAYGGTDPDPPTVREAAGLLDALRARLRRRDGARH
jgi:hypothetical protein